jgi:hypothetical protein
MLYKPACRQAGIKSESVTYRMAKTDPKKKKKPRVHKDLQGFEVSINQFGELSSNMNIEKINEFLDKNVDDKKLAERDDYEEVKKGKKKKK